MNLDFILEGAEEEFWFELATAIPQIGSYVWLRPEAYEKASLPIQTPLKVVKMEYGYNRNNERVLATLRPEPEEAGNA